MRTTPIAELKARLSELLDKLAEGPLVITRHGRPKAVILRAPDDPEDLESLLIAADPHFHDLIDRSRRAKKISHDDFWSRAEKRFGPYSKTRPRAAELRRRGPKRKR